MPLSTSVKAELEQLSQKTHLDPKTLSSLNLTAAEIVDYNKNLIDKTERPVAKANESNAVAQKENNGFTIEVSDFNLKGQTVETEEYTPVSPPDVKKENIEQKDFEEPKTFERKVAPAPVQFEIEVSKLDDMEEGVNATTVA